MMRLRRCCVLVAAIGAFSFSSEGKAPSVAPQCLERVREIAEWLRPEAGFAETRISNREVWDREARTKQALLIIGRAERFLKEKLVAPNDAKYEEVYAWARPLGRIANDWLPTLTYAECLENKGRFLPRIVSILDVLSSMRTWVNPYHDRPDFGSFNGLYRKLELGNGNISQHIALTLDLLRDVLPADCRARALAALRRQVLDVYLEIAKDWKAARRHRCWFYDSKINWCAACNEYFAVSSLLVLDDPIERATAIELAERSTKCYLDGFTAGGMSLEGVGYWSYGFGQYLRLGIMARRATDGRVDFFSASRVKACVRSGFDTYYNDNGAPAYGDCKIDLNCEITWYLAGLVWPEFATEKTNRAAESSWSLPLAMIRLFPVGGHAPDTIRASRIYPIRSWYPDVVQQLVCRPQPEKADSKSLYASFRGGCNDTKKIGHNHNDVGTFGLAIDGCEIVGDPGIKEYDLKTFGPHRYESNLRNSYGHPVPLVDGQMQLVGKLGAKLLGSSFSEAKDEVQIDLRDVYAVTNLMGLTRTFAYLRDEEKVMIRDEIAFDGTGTYETPIVTYGTVSPLGAGVFRVTSRDGKDSLVCRVRVIGGTLTTREETLEAPAKGKPAPKRFALAFAAPVSMATLEMTWEKFVPERTVYPMLTRDGRRLTSWTDGTNIVYDLVPTNRLPNGGGPMREWKLYCLKATHTDVGLHNSQYIQRHGTVQRIENAARLIDADTRMDDDPAAYRYVLEGTWFWENYPMDRGETAAWRIVTNYMARGRMDVGVTCAGNHTHVFSKAELEHSTCAKRLLAEKWGIKTRTFIMADNPGISCSVIEPYAQAGIRHGIFLPNQWNPHPSSIWKRNPDIMAGTWNPDAGGGGARVDVSFDSRLPMVFRWMAPGGTNSLLMWCSTQYHYGYSRLGIAHGRRDRSNVPDVEKRMPEFLALLEAKYPYDIWLAGNYSDDEDANAVFADFAAEWNRKWAWPQFRTVGRLDEPFEYLEKRFGSQIPVVRGEMTSGWLQHVASAPDLLADKLNADRLLETAERLGAYAGTIDPIAVARAWKMLILNDEHSYGTSGYQGRRVFETWMQKRDWIERAAATASNELTKAVAKLGLAPKDESRVEVLPGSIRENAFYRVTVNEKGEIASLFDKALGRELLLAQANRFLYTRDNHKSWCDENLLGATITRRVFLSCDERRVDIEDRFEHAKDLSNANRYNRFGYLAFPFNVPNGAFKARLAGGEVIRPYEDCHPIVSDAYVAVRDWCAVENDDFGVALMMRDSMLTEFGEIHPDKTCYTGQPPKGSATIYPFLFTDWLQMHQPDGDSMNFTFRFSITSYAAYERHRVEEVCADWLNPYAKWMRKQKVPTAKRVLCDTAADGWTGLIEAPRAGHGEKDGQLYLLWGAELSPTFSHYELWRDGAFRAVVTNEAPRGIPYRVARFEDTGLPTHSTHSYRLLKVWKDGRKESFGGTFSGRTRFVSEEERNGIVCEGEDGRLAIRFDGAQVTSWKPEVLKGEDVFFLPKDTPWGQEVHGGLPICWPWFGKPEKEGLPKHGLVRYLRWNLVRRNGKNGVVLRTRSNMETRKLWPHDFELEAHIGIVGASALKVTIIERNTGTNRFESACAIHPYFSMSDATNVELDGTRLPRPWTQRTFGANGKPHVLGDGVRRRRVEVSSPQATRWMVWNPGEERAPLCNGLQADDWRRFYCLEPIADQSNPLNPGKSRRYDFTIRVLSAPTVEDGRTRQTK